MCQTAKPPTLPRRWSSWLAAGWLVFSLGCGGGHHPGNGRTNPTRPPQPGSGTLSGRLTDRNTALALAGATVFAQNDGRPVLQARAVTAADGSFTLTRLPLGVALRVVCQPVTGAIAYEAAVSGPVTLVKDALAPTVNLACSPVAQTGTVEGAKAPRPGRAARIVLVQKKDAGGGKILKIVVRTAQAADHGAFRFATVPPGHYEVHFLTRGRFGPRPPGPRRPNPQRRPRRRNRVVEITVKAMETTHVAWPASLQADAEAGDPEADEVELDEAEDSGQN